MIWFFLSKDLLLVDRVILIYDFFLQIFGLYIDEGSAFVCFLFFFYYFKFVFTIFSKFFIILLQVLITMVCFKNGKVTSSFKII